MEHQAPNNNGQSQNPDLPDPNNGQTHDTQLFSEEIDSTCSTPYVSAPSSPGRASGSGPVNGGFFYSAPASPMHFALTSVSFSSPSIDNSVPLGSEFEFSARFGSNGSGTPGSMSSADELFLDGKIRPMKLSTHLERPQMLAPLMDLEQEDEDYEEKDESRVVNSSSRGRDLRLRDKSMRRRTRSLSPLRSFQWTEDFTMDDKDKEQSASIDDDKDEDSKNEEVLLSEETTPSASASSSRSSSAGRSSKRWVFLKDFLYRSKSEGRSTSNSKFWSTISFSQGKEKKPMNSIGRTSVQDSVSKEKLTSMGVENQKSKVNGQVLGKKPVNGVGKRRVPPSPHELHYKANRSQAEEMRKKTFLPYRQGLLGCLGFSSKGYGAMNGFARALNPVSSR